MQRAETQRRARRVGRLRRGLQLGALGAGFGAALLAGALAGPDRASPSASQGPRAALEAPPEPAPRPAEALRDALAQAGIQHAIAARECRASENAEGLQAPNRRHGFRTYFEPGGIRVQDPSGTSVAGTNWAYVAGDGTAEAKVLVSPAIEPNGGQDWVLKLEAPVEIRRIKVGFEDTSGGHQLLGCDATDCCPGTCSAGVCSASNPLLGPSVDLCQSRAEYDALLQTLYVVLQGELDAESFLGDHTLLSTPNQPAPDGVGDGCRCGDAKGDGRGPGLRLRHQGRADAGAGHPGQGARNQRRVLAQHPGPAPGPVRTRA